MQNDLSIHVKITVERPGHTDEGSFGKGTAALLEGVKEKGSLNRAAKDLGMAYSKAWRMLKDVEQNFGITFLERDGARGSTLTAEGEKFLAFYKELDVKTTAYTMNLFKEHFN